MMFDKHCYIIKNISKKDVEVLALAFDMNAYKGLDIRLYNRRGQLTSRFSDDVCYALMESDGTYSISGVLRGLLIESRYELVWSEGMEYNPQ